MPKVEGVIVKIVTPKYYGFIQYQGEEYFFHRDDFKGHWYDLVHDFEGGQSIRVEFSPQQMFKGPRAHLVSRVDWPNQAV